MEKMDEENPQLLEKNKEENEVKPGQWPIDHPAAASFKMSASYLNLSIRRLTSGRWPFLFF